ncbi:MAG: TonB-dependent receptor [Pseudomonadota bacterium]
MAMPPKLFKSLFVPTVLMVAISAVSAADQIQIDEVTVYGQSIEETIPKDLSKYGSRLEVITAEQLQRTGVRDIAQALQMLAPGLFIAPKNGAFDYVKVSLQGSRPQDILWLVDGVRINNRLYASTSPLDTLPAVSIDRIEILKGGQGIFYGTQSVAGVINIVTRDVSSDDAYQNQFGIGIDDNDGRHIDGYHRIESGKHSAIVFASSNESEGFQPYTDEDFQPSATDRKRGYDNVTLGMKYAYQFDSGARASFFYQRNEADLDFARPTDNFFTQNNREEDLAYVKLDTPLSETSEFMLKAYYHNWDTRYTRLYNDTANPGTLVVRNDGTYWGYKDYGVNAMARFFGSEALEYIAGVDLQRFNGSDDVLLIGNQTESVESVFTQIRTQDNWLADTQLAFGVRYNKPSGEGDSTVGQLTGRHQFSESLYIRGNVGTSFRLPSAYELYAVDSCCTQGNPDLEPEEGENIHFAIGNESGALTWEVAMFTRKVSNLIVSTDGVFANSDDEVDFEGSEIFLDWQVNENLSASLNYVQTKAEAQGSDQQVDDIPESHAKLIVNYAPRGSLYELQLAAVRVGDIYDQVSNVGRVNYGNYTVLDVSAQLWLDTAQQHQLGVRLENLTDEEYAASVGSASRDSDSSSYAYENLGTPRTLHATYRYNF